MNLSIVTATYNSGNYINNFIIQISEVIEKYLKLLDYEIIVVDDGSQDDTVSILLELKKKYPKIKIIELSKNFGQHKALREGLRIAKGEKVYTTDADLEETPDLVKIFNDIMDEKKLDLVFGYQGERSKSKLNNFFAELFYKFFNFISASQIPPNVTTAHLMTKKVLNEFLSFKETDIFYQGIIHSIGFKKEGVRIEKKYKESSEYNLKKKLIYFIDGIVSFSNYPLYILSFVGFFLVFISIIYNVYLIIDYNFISKNHPGWLSIIGLVSLLSGFIILSVGILGIYISKIYNEIKSRPVIIKNKYL